MKNSVILMVIFNHKYDKNIPILREIYKNRFSKIYFLVPFYQGTEDDVIPVYENSYYFQGYIAQGFKKFYNSISDHYFFIADDMVLNPAINEHNYTEFFQLQQDESFIPEVFSLHNFTNEDTLQVEDIFTTKPGRLKKFWGRTKMAFNYSPLKRGVEIAKEIPSYKEAENLLKEHGFPIETLYYNDIYGGIKPETSFSYKIPRILKLIKNAGLVTKKFPLRYPLVASYADIVIVSKDTIRQFVHYCGVFAATELFVELAIPTALLLASDKIKTEPVIGKRGIIYWNCTPKQKVVYKSDMLLYNYDLQKLLTQFPADKLYIHPIKLSKWKTDLPPAS